MKNNHLNLFRNVKTHLSREGREEGVERLSCDEGHVLEEGILHQDGEPHVEVVTVHQQDALQKAEATKRVVAGTHSLPTFFPHDTCYTQHTKHTCVFQCNELTQEPTNVFSYQRNL